ncbi:hypothetical protein RRG08_061646 [Elysia crispata]|uniref:Uncharacterized protein n=1 Tax=Elysia crispata TaxID=231223 RepID=A0AAE1AR77_9GAST|nr:hypothetical protein RRG08_061646 [Elysia crispata]
MGRHKHTPTEAASPWFKVPAACRSANGTLRRGLPSHVDGGRAENPGKTPARYVKESVRHCSIVGFLQGASRAGEKAFSSCKCPLEQAIYYDEKGKIPPPTHTPTEKSMLPWFKDLHAATPNVRALKSTAPLHRREIDGRCHPRVQR